MDVKKVLQLTWDALPQDLINKAILSFTKRICACVKTWDGYFEISCVNCIMFNFIRQFVDRQYREANEEAHRHQIGLTDSRRQSTFNTQ